MANLICSVEDCCIKHLAKGFCSKHYNRFVKYGSPTVLTKVRGECSIEDCNNPHIAKGYCRKHYLRFQKHGSPEVTKKTPNGFYGDTCIVEFCNKKPKSKGYCGAHMLRLKRNGDPLIKKHSYHDYDHCIADGCNSDVHGFGYCVKHYQRYKKYGNSETVHSSSYDDEQETYMYRLYNNCNDLLYVGITVNLATRFRQHRSSKKWWSEVSRTDVVKFSKRHEAALAELKSINSENPVYNIKRRKVKNEN